MNHADHHEQPPTPDGVLRGPASLNWAVAKAEGNKVFRPRIGRPNDWDRAAWEKDGSDNRFVVRVQNPTLGYFVD